MSSNKTPSVAHIFACNGSINCGDYMLGISTKYKFNEIINKKCTFTNLDCRNKSLFTPEKVKDLNKYDYVIIGGGGLILPDTCPNSISGWQWLIHENSISLIKVPIYVIGIGFNLFFNQKITMQNRNDNKEKLEILNIFSSNITQLVKQSTYFSLRHNQDVIECRKYVQDENLKSKIIFDFCPVVYYVKEKWKPSYILDNKKYIAFEVKEDRPFRRYFNITKDDFYKKLLDVIVYLKTRNESVCFLSHDNSLSFYNFLNKNNINVDLLKNSTANESKIQQNFNKIKCIICTAGHSQMIAHSMGIKTISMVSHPKLKYFCDDIEDTNYIEINKTTSFVEHLKTMIYSE